MSALPIEPATVDWLNELSAEDAAEQFRKCCGADWWGNRMAEARPFADVTHLLTTADRLFDAMPREEWLVGFTNSPRIGDIDSLSMRSAGNKPSSAGEQAGVTADDDAALQGLARGSDRYEDQFGYPFIVSATGKSPAEVLASLEERLANDAETEFALTCGEQRKITHSRLAELSPDG